MLADLTEITELTRSTGVSIICIRDLDPTSLFCTQIIDQFGNIIAVCDYSRVLYADMPFTFAAFE